MIYIKHLLVIEFEGPINLALHQMINIIYIPECLKLILQTITSEFDSYRMVHKSSPVSGKVKLSLWFHAYASFLINNMISVHKFSILFIMQYQAWWLLLKKMGLASQVQNLDKAVCISLCTNAFGKGIYLFLVLPVKH